MRVSPESPGTQRCSWIQNQGRHWEKMSITRFPIELVYPKVGVPGSSGHMKYKARKKQLLCRYLLKHM